MTHTFTREELYELVWSIPIARLAEQFGVSDRRLTKICERHQVPVPGRRYWTALQAGQSATKTPLWRIEAPSIETVYIGPMPPEVDPSLAFAIDATRSAKQALEEEQKTPQSAYGAVAQPRGLGAGEVRKRKLHPSIRHFAKELSSAAADRAGALNVRWVHVHSDSIQRVTAFLNALVHEFNPKKIIFSGTGSRVAFKLDETLVDFEITSPKKRVITEGELGWKHYQNIFVGRLAFRIFGRAPGIKKLWVDDENHKIEDLISEIVASYRINLVVQKAIDEKERSERLQKEHLAHRRRLVLEREAREEARLSFLRSLAAIRHEVDDLKLAVEAIPPSEAHDHEYGRMLVWARSRLAALEDQISAGSIQRALIDQNLFPEPDDLYDPEGEP